MGSVEGIGRKRINYVRTRFSPMVLDMEMDPPQMLLEVLRDLRMRFVEKFDAYPQRLRVSNDLSGYLDALADRGSPNTVAPTCNRFWNMDVVRGPALEPASKRPRIPFVQLEEDV